MPRKRRKKLSSQPLATDTLQAQNSRTAQSNRKMDASSCHGPCGACMTRTPPETQEGILRHAPEAGKTPRSMMLFRDVWPALSRICTPAAHAGKHPQTDNRQAGIRSRKQDRLQVTHCSRLSTVRHTMTHIHHSGTVSAEQARAHAEALWKASRRLGASFGAIFILISA